MESLEEPNGRRPSFPVKSLANSAFGLLLKSLAQFLFLNTNLSLVPNQTPDSTSMHGLVEAYLTEQFNNLHTKCTMTITEIPGSAPPWLGNVDDPSFQAAEKAVKVRIHCMAPLGHLYVRTNGLVVIGCLQKGS